MSGAPGELRVSDQEREQVASEIREHFAQGRLTQEELDERLALAYAARTQSDLEALRHDLPRLPATRAETRAAIAERRAELSRHLVQQTGYALVPFAICTLIWAASGAGASFWPIWVLIVAAVPLLRNLWRLYGPAPDLDAAEAHLRRRDHRGGRLPPGPPPPAS